MAPPCACVWPSQLSRTGTGSAHGKRAHANENQKIEPAHLSHLGLGDANHSRKHIMIRPRAVSAKEYGPISRRTPTERRNENPYSAP